MYDDLEADGFQGEHTETQVQFQKQEELLVGLHEVILGWWGQLGHFNVSSYSLKQNTL